MYESGLGSINNDSPISTCAIIPVTRVSRTRTILKQKRTSQIQARTCDDNIHGLGSVYIECYGKGSRSRSDWDGTRPQKVKILYYRS